MIRTNLALALLLTIAAVLWTAAIFLVPMTDRTSPAAALVRAAGGLVCHQRANRSFHVAGGQMPVCARCTGLYVSGALASLLAWYGLPRPPRHTRALLIATALPIAVTVAAEWTGLVQPGNSLRAAAALPLGGAAGWLFVQLLRAEAPPTTCAIIS